MFPYTQGSISEAGIKIQDLEHLNLIGNAAAPNQFKDMRNGIISNSCDLRVSNCSFKNIRNPSNTSIEGYGIYSTYFYGTSTSRLNLTGLGVANSSTLTFDNCRIGVNVVGTDLSMKSCAMDNMNVGVLVNYANWKDILISNNRIKCKDYGIVSLGNQSVHNALISNNLITLNQTTVSPSLLPTGIGIWEANGQQTPHIANRYLNNLIHVQKGLCGLWLLGTDRTQVSGNAVIMDDFTTTAAGMLVSGASRPVLSCNSIQGADPIQGNVLNETPASIWIEGSIKGILSCNNTNNTRVGTRFAGNCYPYSFRGNSTGEHLTGLHYTSSSVTGWQGANTLGNGNKWTSTYTIGNRVGAWHENASLYPFSIYTIDNYSSIYSPQRVRIGSAVSPPLAMNSQTWFQFKNGIQMYNCPSNICASAVVISDNHTHDGHKMSVDSLDYQIADSSYQATYYPEATLWSLQRNLFNAIPEDSILYQDSLFYAFYENAKNTSAGRFEDLADNIDSLYRPSIVDINTMEAFRTTVRDLSDSIAVKEIVLQDSTLDSLQTATIRQQIALLQLSLRSANTSLRVMSNTLQAIAEAGADSLRVINSLLPSQSIFEQNEIAVNEIYLSAFVRGNHTLDETQIAIISAIAHQCPLAGGNAVYLARAIYATINDSERYDDKATCVLAGLQYKQMQPTKEESKEKVNRLEIYPNPSDDLVSIRLTEKRLGTGKISVYDSFGKLIFELSLDLEKGETTFDVSSWNTGVYFITVNALDCVFSGKVVVLR